MANSMSESDAPRGRKLQFDFVYDTLNRNPEAKYCSVLYEPRHRVPHAPYFLMYLPDTGVGAPPEPSDSLSLEDLWQQVGCFIFTERANEDPESWAKDLHTALQPDVAGNKTPQFVWPTPKSGELQIIHTTLDTPGAPSRPVKHDVALRIGRYQLAVHEGTLFELTGETIGFDKDVTLIAGAGDAKSCTDPKLNLVGPRSGTIEAGFSTSIDVIKRLGGGEFRSLATTGQRIQFPFLPDVFDFQKYNLGWNVSAPLDPYRSFLQFVEQPVLGSFLRTPTGLPLTVRPTSDARSAPAGFAFALSAKQVVQPNTQGAAGDPTHFIEFEHSGLDYYLTPSGSYKLSNPDFPTLPVHVMCGAIAAEYLALSPDDLLCFVPSGAASSGAQAQHQGWTTAWATILPAMREEGKIGASFCKQPDTVPFFDNVEGYAPPVGIQLCDLAEGGAYFGVPFPLFPYAGAYSTVPQHDENDDKIVHAAINRDFTIEGILHPDLRKVRAEIFSSWGDHQGDPVFFNIENHALLGGYARTAEGLMLDINPAPDQQQAGQEAPAGTIKRIYLAKAPDTKKDTYFSISPTDGNVVDADFSGALLSGADLVICTDPTKMPMLAEETGFRNEIKMADFPFKLDVGAGKATVLFKFSNSKSLNELLQEAESGVTSPKHFLDGQDLPQALAAIRKAIDSAEASQRADTASVETTDHSARHKPAFGHFLQIINEQSWTGFLVVDCPLDYSALPADIATLMGGIRSAHKIPAHHVGVTINRPRPGQERDPIQNSSIFAVIFYERDLILEAESYEIGFQDWKDHLEYAPPQDLDFETLRLEVLFENSTQQLFSTRIALSTPDLFGGDVTFEEATKDDSISAKTMVVDGHQVRHPDGTGSLVFEWPKDRVFKLSKGDEFHSVLERITFLELNLRGITTHTEGNVTKANSIFEFECDLKFLGTEELDQSPMLGDVFSYDRLRIGAYGLNTKVTIEEGTLHVPELNEDLGSARVIVKDCFARDHSVVSSWPLDPKKVNAIANWSEQASDGWWVKGVVPDGTVEPLPTGKGYSLEFDFPLGTPGQGATQQKHIVGRFCLAWSAGGHDAPDQHGIWFSLGTDNMNLSGMMKTSLDYVEMKHEPAKPPKGAPVTTKDPKMEYKLYLKNYQVHVFGYTLPVNKSSMLIRVDPDDPKGKLSWLVLPEPDEKDEKLFDKGLVAKLPIFVGHGKFDTDVNPVTDTNYISDVVEGLLGKVLAPEFQTEDSHPGAGDDLVVAMAFSLPMVDFKFLYHAKDFCGGRLEFHSDPTKVDGSAEANIGRYLVDDPTKLTIGWGGGPELQKIWDQLDGAIVEIYYKHLKTGVDVVSANFVLPSSIANRKVNALTHKRLEEVNDEIEDYSKTRLEELQARDAELKEAKKKKDEDAEELPEIKKKIEDSEGDLEAKRKAVEDAHNALLAGLHTPHARGFRQKKGFKGNRAQKDAAQKRYNDARLAKREAQKDLDAHLNRHEGLEAEQRKANRAVQDSEMEHNRVSIARDLLEAAYLLKKLTMDAEKVALEAAPEIHIGNMSVAIFIGQDTRFRVALGWPISDNPFELILGHGADEVVPFFKAGLYFAYLSPEDLPGSFGAENVPHYGNIFAGGIAFGGGKRKEWNPGVLEIKASWEVDVSAQVYVAEARALAKAGDGNTPGGTGEKYVWFSFQVSLTGEASLKVDFKIIVISASIKIVLAFGLSVETNHKTVLELTADVTVKGSISFTFITIHLTFHKKIALGGPWTFGDGAVADVSKPTPQLADWSYLVQRRFDMDAAAEKAKKEKEAANGKVPVDPKPLASETAAPDHASVAAARMAFAGQLSGNIFENADQDQMALADHGIDGLAGHLLQAIDHHESGADRLPIVLHFMVQTTAGAAEGTDWRALGIASLLIDIGGDAGARDPATPTDFSRLCASLMTYLSMRYGEATGDVGRALQWETPFKDRDPSLADRSWIYEWLQNEPLTFRAADPAAHLHSSVFPMIPGLTLSLPSGQVALAETDEAHHALEDYVEFLANSLFEAHDEIDKKAKDWWKDTSPDLKQAQAASDAATAKAPAKATASFAARLAAAKLVWATAAHANNPDKDAVHAAQAAVIALEKQKAYTEHHYQIAGNLSRMMCAGTSKYDPDAGTFRSIYTLTGQQFDLPPAAETADAADSGHPVSLIDPKTGENLTYTVPVNQAYDAIDDATLGWGDRMSTAPNLPGWVFGQLPAILRQPKRRPLSRQLEWSGEETQIIAPFCDELRLALQTRKAGPASVIVTKTVVGDNSAQVHHDTASANWQGAHPALVIPIHLHRVEKIVPVVNDPLADKPASAPPSDGTGSKKQPLEDVVELEGTDEASRALLELLLIQAESDAASDAANGATSPIHSIDMIYRGAKAKSFSTLDLTGMLLIKTNLSTATSGATTGETSVPPKAPYFARPDNANSFLRLIWEASVVHVGGFLLKLDAAAIKSLFGDKKKATLKLVISSAVPSTPHLPIERYHNTVVGPQTDGLLTTTIADRNGAVDQEYVPAHSPQDVGVEIIDRMPIGANGISPQHITTGQGDAVAQADNLRQLYTVFACQDVDDHAWSPPMHGMEAPAFSAKGMLERHYAHLFPLPDGQASDYSWLGQTRDVRLSVSDLYGNVSPSHNWPRGGDVITLKSVYNDPIIGLGHWPGVRPAYRVADQDGLKLIVDLGFKEIMLGDLSTDDDDTRQKRAQKAKPLAEAYRKILAQLNDPRLRVSIDTTLRDGTPHDQDDDGKAALIAYVNALLDWLKPGADVSPVGEDRTPPPEANIAYGLDKTYPANWTWLNPNNDTREAAGDLLELKVAMVLERSWSADDGQTASDEDAWFTLPDEADLGSGTSRDIRELMPTAKRVATPIEAEQHTDGVEGKTDLNLRKFAMDFETVFAGFDDADGRLKVASGIVSDPTDVMFGHSNIWVMRWSPEKGVAMKRAEGDALFSAPVPVNRHLITRAVDDLGDDHEERVFSSVDLDVWAADFLSSVQSLFGPELAPIIAEQSAENNPDAGFDQLGKSKAALATTVKRTLDWVFQGDYKDKSEAQTRKLGQALTAAEEVMLQAMLADLENDYDTAVVAQIPMDVTLQDQIEPWDEPGQPAPNLFGPIGTKDIKDKPTLDALPYRFSNSKLPLRHRDGPEWLNFTVQAVNPSQQSFFEVDMDFSATAVEHNIHPDHAKNGYVPSSWLTFILPVDTNPEDPRPNTLTTDLGLKGQDPTKPDEVAKTIIPVPLRSFPPNPKLIRQTATPSPKDPDQAADVPSIEDVLLWDLHVAIETPSLGQDRLVLQVVFNEEVGQPQTQTDASHGTQIDDPHVKLFEALARFRFGFDTLKTKASLKKPASVTALNTLISNVVDAWQPVANAQKANRINRPEETGANANHLDSGHDTWEYEVIPLPPRATDDEATGDKTTDAATPDLRVPLKLVKLSKGDIRWPLLDGYGDPVANGEGEMLYTPKPLAAATPGVGRTSYNFIWERLYVLQYQSAHAGAFIIRNERLAPEDASSIAKPQHDDWNTNPAFVYKSELVRFTTPIVPLLSAHIVQGISNADRKGAVAEMLDRFRKKMTDDAVEELRVELQLNYSYELVAKAGKSLRPSRAVFLTQAVIGAKSTDIQGVGEQSFADDHAAAVAICDQIQQWEAQHLHPDQNNKPAWDFACTLFATKIVQKDRLLPLVRIGQVELAKDLPPDA